MSDKHIRLPFLSISGNHYYQECVSGKRVIRFVSKKGLEFKDLVKKCASSHTPFKGPVSLTVIMYMNDKRKRDIDNFIGKSLLDALKGIAYVDDEQVWEKHSYKRYSKTGFAMTDIIVQEIDIEEDEINGKL